MMIWQVLVLRWRSGALNMWDVERERLNEGGTCVCKEVSTRSLRRCRIS